MTESNIILCTLSFCEFCKSRQNVQMYHDQVFGTIHMCSNCSQHEVIEPQRCRALKTQLKMNKIDMYITQSLQSLK